MVSRRLLFIGDVVGEAGRKAVRDLLPKLREVHSPDLVVANGENIAGGVGITERTAKALLDYGVDVVTTGNHVYRHRDVYAFLDSTDRVIRPANYMAANPGKGYVVIEKGDVRWAVINLSGSVGLQVARLPFHEIDRILAGLEADLI